jgi:hypothetical protein
MEGFSTPWSSKRRASLPSPHPIDLQSLSSAPPGFPHLRLYQATDPHRIHTTPGYLPLRPCWALVPCWIHALSGPPLFGPCQIHTPLGFLPLGHARTQHRTGSTLCWDPCPMKPTALRPCWTPALCRTTEFTPHLDEHLLCCARSKYHQDPHPSAALDPSLELETTLHHDPRPSGSPPLKPWQAPAPCRTTRASPASQGWEPVWCLTAASPSPPGYMLFGQSQAPPLQVFHITAPPGSLPATTRGFKKWLRDTHTDRTGC